MLHVSEEDFRSASEEEARYQALLLKETRRSLAGGLRFRTWLTAALSLAAIGTGVNPRLRIIWIAAAAVLPLFLWHAWQFLHLDRYLDRRVEAAADRRHLASLASRAATRDNIIAQKKAQDEIERLRKEIDELRTHQGVAP